MPHEHVVSRTCVASKITECGEGKFVDSNLILVGLACSMQSLLEFVKLPHFPVHTIAFTRKSVQLVPKQLVQLLSQRLIKISQLFVDLINCICRHDEGTHLFVYLQYINHHLILKDLKKGFGYSFNTLQLIFPFKKDIVSPCLSLNRLIDKIKKACPP